MSLGSLRNLWLGVAALLALRAFAQSPTPAPNQLTADEVIREAVEHAQKTETRPNLSDYTYTKTSVTEELDSSGKVKERKEKVYSIIARGGATSQRLIEVNGQPTRNADARKRTEEEPKSRRSTGEPKARKSSNHDNFVAPDVVAHFNFKLVGQTNVNGRPTYQLVFQPRKCPPPGNRIADRVMNHLSGTIWIDVQEFEVAGVDAQLGSEVTFLGGVVGSLKKLSFTATRTRVADGVWLETYSLGVIEARKLLDQIRVRAKSQSTNFSPLRLES